MIQRSQTPYQMKKSAAAWASQVNNNQHLQSEVQAADAHQLIGMLFKATLSHLEDAHRGSERQDAASRTKWLNKSIACLSELRISLRHDLAPELSANLDNLYEYSARLLGRAKVQATNEKGFAATRGLIKEVQELLTPLQEAWDQVHQEALKFREDLAEYQKNLAAKSGPKNTND